ncbi:Ribonuclease [Pseudobythopirellula maris]|uniref:Ribonuclease n=1 Tax=Pseudobythopirellula maris TaxID=2527991 RepID=A0A5C5ZP61_9BACT|nr:MBL fold metallo-hydrolase [Pseudobythopirellula maris]TWT88936.1 Ribonuclease [Pseudobythopirellula maris]
MFHYEDGLMLTGPRLAIDFRRRQPRSFVSHAHADHMGRHELALCTPETAALYRARMSPKLATLEMPWDEAIEYGPLRLTATPAGHCMGSAMLLADDGAERLLYTGDYKLGESLTARPADPPQADILVMESTFGRPRYRMPPRKVVIEQLLELVHAALADGRTPVIHAYAMGKSQEVTKILTTHGVPVLQHPEIYRISQVYEGCGVALASPGADYAAYAGRPLAGHAVITTPPSMKGYRLAELGRVTSFAVTGWAIDPSTKYRQRVDHALPLSDHADYDELVETVRRVEPKRVLCTHGPVDFVDDLLGLGFNAEPLEPQRQGRLF